MIKGFAEALAETPNLTKIKKYLLLKKSLKNSIRLQALVDDLLNLSELEGNKDAINPTNNKLSDVIKGIDLYLQDKPYIDSSKLKFSFENENDGFPMDVVKIAMAISNLIDNALNMLVIFMR